MSENDERSFVGYEERSLPLRGRSDTEEDEREVNGNETEARARYGRIVVDVPPLRDVARVRARRVFDSKQSARSPMATVGPRSRTLPNPIIVDHPFQFAQFVVADNIVVSARAGCEVNGTPGHLADVGLARLWPNVPTPS